MIPQIYRERFKFIGSHEKVALLLLAVLLFFRMIVLGVLGYFDDTRSNTWIDPLSQLGIYILTAILIWWERDRLADFHIDDLSIAIILLFKPFQTLILAVWKIPTVFAVPNLPSFSFWVIAIGLALALIATRCLVPQPRAVSFGWFIVGTLAGIITAILLSYPLSLQFNLPPYANRQSPIQLLTDFALRFPYQIGYAGVTEEPMFRGFLWGYLRKAGWRDIWIWLFQAGLFMLAHIYYLNRAPLSFWVIVPLGGLVLGLLAWRSRSITASLAAHGAINAFGQILSEIIVSYRL